MNNIGLYALYYFKNLKAPLENISFYDKNFGIKPT